MLRLRPTTVQLTKEDVQELKDDIVQQQRDRQLQKLYHLETLKFHSKEAIDLVFEKNLHGTGEEHPEKQQQQRVVEGKKPLKDNTFEAFLTQLPPLSSSIPATSPSSKRRSLAGKNNSDSSPSVHQNDLDREFQ